MIIDHVQGASHEGKIVYMSAGGPSLSNCGVRGAERITNAAKSRGHANIASMRTRSALSCQEKVGVMGQGSSL